MHRSVNNWVYLRPKVGMQQYITIWIDGKGVAISSKLHSTKGNGEIIQKPHISESNTRDIFSDMLTLYVGVFFLISLIAMSTPMTPRMSWFCMQKT